MIEGLIKNIKIAGITTVVPENRVESKSRYSDFGSEAVEKIIEKTGVEAVYQSIPKQTASDLAYQAAEKLITYKNIDKKSIGALILVTQTPDYKMPATAFVLQKRLNLGKECICFDINLGCSGYLNGLYTLAALMNSSNIERALLLCAETPSKRISKLDRSLSMIFGDCGTATLLEKEQDTKEMKFSFKSLGDRYNKIIMPAGGYRHPDESSEQITFPNGNIRSKYDTYMDGHDVFAFSIAEVPGYMKKFIKSQGKKAVDYDWIVLHQANQFILKQIAKSLKVDTNKVPISMLEYGNTSANSIPLTLSFLKDEIKEGDFNCLLSGFGIGLSFAIADLNIDFKNIYPVEHSDYFYDENIDDLYELDEEE